MLIRISLTSDKVLPALIASLYLCVISHISFIRLSTKGMALASTIKIDCDEKNVLVQLTYSKKEEWAIAATSTLLETLIC